MEELDGSGLAMAQVGSGAGEHPLPPPAAANGLTEAQQAAFDINRQRALDRREAKRALDRVPIPGQKCFEVPYDSSKDLPRKFSRRSSGLLYAYYPPLRCTA